MTANYVEIIWTAIAMTGASLCVFALLDSREDLRYVNEFKINGAVALACRGTLRRERIRLFIQLLMATAGVMAMLTPADNRPLDTPRVIILSALMLMSILHVVNTLYDRADLKKLRGMKLANSEKMQATLDRIEQQGEANLTRDEGVASDLLASRDRADDIEKGTPGEAADAALRHAEGEERRG